MTPSGSQGRHRLRVSALLLKWQGRCGAFAYRPVAAALLAVHQPRYKRVAALGRAFKAMAKDWCLATMRRWLRDRCEHAWPGAPSFSFLSTLAGIPHRIVGPIPRFAVLRWATAEDDDWWLPQRRTESRTQLCSCGCGVPARTYPYGHQYGGIAEHHVPTSAALALLAADDPPALESVGPPLALLRGDLLLPAPVVRVLSSPDLRKCVLCGGADNTVDHWVRWCPVFYLVGRLLSGGRWSVWTPRQAESLPTPHIAAVTLILFHMRRRIVAHGGLLGAGSAFAPLAPTLTHVQTIAAAVVGDMAVETARVVGFNHVSPEPAPQDCPSYRGVEAVAPLPLH